ncbi:hypothetical protein TorRG33x02_005920 [Trema orientale]|uniref:Uncharacterized protein n=1 Tax=Trema orientale TaxID=63057 RepID=A0A2P5G042_TREOI|nr:hypothetical protein TorRG33x02_005920 [Trema orientale]
MLCHRRPTLLRGRFSPSTPPPPLPTFSSQLPPLTFVSDPPPWMLLNTGSATADLFTLQLSMLCRHQASSPTILRRLQRLCHFKIQLQRLEISHFSHGSPGSVQPSVMNNNSASSPETSKNSGLQAEKCSAFG